MKESNAHTSIEEYIKTIEKVGNQLKEKGEITLNDYNSYNTIKRKVNELKEDSTILSSINKGQFNYDLQFNKLKLLLEKIQAEIQNKKDYEFISNYFITENNPLSIIDYSLLSPDSNNKDNDNLSAHISHQSLSTLDSIELDSINSLGDVLKLTSPLFLSEKAKFRDEVIHKITAGNHKANSATEINSLPKEQTKDNPILKKKSSKKKILPELNKENKKEAMRSKPISSQNPNEKIDKEIEEEINNQIFKYTKSMKENARAFNSQLKQDNKTLSSIEDIQIKDQDKTDKETKRLKEFNYTLSIGFFRLLMMFIVTIVVFVFTLLIMRIFPKFT